MNLNDEAAELETLEQSYEAASKLFTALDQVMVSALNMGVETASHKETAMRVNPNYMTNLVGSLDATSSTEENLTEELASGSQVNALSDNPVAVGQNVLLSAQINSDDSFCRRLRRPRACCRSAILRWARW